MWFSTSFPPTPAGYAWRRRLASGFLCAVAWGLGGVSAAAEDAKDSRTSRLGFKFDQAAHDAAVAAETTRNRTGNEPLPAGVIRLPRLPVIARALPKSRETLTPQGRIDLAEKRYEAPFYRAIIGPLEAVGSLLNNPLGGWNPNAPEALALYEDDEQLRRRVEMSDLLDLATLADRASRAAGKSDSAAKSSQ